MTPSRANAYEIPVAAIIEHFWRRDHGLLPARPAWWRRWWAGVRGR